MLDGHVACMRDTVYKI